MIDDMGNETPDGLFDDNRAITQKELCQVLTETQDILSEMKDVINTHAEVIASHRWVLDRFVPKPLLAEAFRSYYEARSKAIDLESAEPDATKQN